VFYKKDGSIDENLHLVLMNTVAGYAYKLIGGWKYIP
jgi:hypothetical protein